MPSGQASRLGFWFLEPTPTPPGPGVLNPTPINNLADYIVVDYSFTNGSDLDTRTRFTTPVVGSYIGWSRGSSVSNFMYWGGDNTGTGLESILININNYKALTPGTYPTQFQIDFNCFWYGTVGTNPVYLTMYMYTGGTMQKQGFTWINPTATSSQTLTSAGKIITLQTTNSASNGEPLGYISYDVDTGVGFIDIYP